MPSTPERPRRITVDPEGPILVEGPVEVVGEDGVPIVSRRFVVALCTCRRSRSYPWCDTSHRRRSQPGPDSADDPKGACALAEPDTQTGRAQGKRP